MAKLMPPTHDLIQKAHSLADEMGHPLVGSEHLLLAMVQADDNLAAHRILCEAGSFPAVERRLSEMFGHLPR